MTDFKVGLSLFGLSPRHYPAISKRAEEVGFESVWLGEHLVFPSKIPDTYPYAEGGVAPVDPGTHLFDPWVVLADIAARTQNLRLGTSVYILPLRHPLVTARAVATLDRVSGGRVLLGAGIGWLKEEFDLVGESFANRGPRSEEILDLLRVLWTETEIDFRGRYYQLGPLRFEPKPAQKPHPPLIMGGESELALERAARTSDGWIGAGALGREELTAAVQRLRELRRGFGDAPFEITTFNRYLPTNLETALWHRDIGIDRLNLMPSLRPDGGLSADDVIAFVERSAEEILVPLAHG